MCVPSFADHGVDHLLVRNLQEQRPAQSNSNSFSRDLSSDNELNLGDNDNEFDVAEKKRFAGVSRRKSVSYNQDEYKKTSAEEEMSGQESTQLPVQLLC